MKTLQLKTYKSKIEYITNMSPILHKVDQICPVDQIYPLNIIYQLNQVYSLHRVYEFFNNNINSLYIYIYNVINNLKNYKTLLFFISTSFLFIYILNKINSPKKNEDYKFMKLEQNFFKNDINHIKVDIKITTKLCKYIIYCKSYLENLYQKLKNKCSNLTYLSFLLFLLVILFLLIMFIIFYLFYLKKILEKQILEYQLYNNIQINKIKKILGDMTDEMINVINTVLTLESDMKMLKNKINFKY